jgi:hypothetical protein
MPPPTSALRPRVREYERRADALLRQVERMRRLPRGRHGASEERRSSLSWAETQLAITRRLAGALAVSADSEAVEDVCSLLDQRLHRVQARLDALGP